MLNKSYFDCIPEVLGASTFRSSVATPNSEQTKNQYIYRLLCVLYGRNTLLLSGKEYILEGSVTLKKREEVVRWISFGVPLNHFLKLT